MYHLHFASNNHYNSRTPFISIKPGEIVIPINLTRVPSDQLHLYADFFFPAHRAIIDNPEEKNLYAIAAKEMDENETIGFALAWGADNKVDFELITVYVNLFFRRRGIGRKLLSYIGNYFLDAGFKRGVYYFSFPDDDQGIPAFLSTSGWQIARINQIICRSTLALADDTPWLNRARLSVNYSIMPWHELNGAQRAHIKQHNQQEKRKTGKGWYAEDQNPFRQEDSSHKETSLALLKGSEVKGWVITHTPEELPGILRWTVSFVCPTLQTVGRILPLWKAVYACQKRYSDCQDFIWGVPVEHPRMLKFAKRHMRPWLKEMRYSCMALCDLESKKTKSIAE